MGFSLTPATGFPSQTPEEFPNYIQFQNSGTDLGTNDADTVNFRRGMRATRGTGENGAVVTVDSAGLTWREIADDSTIEADDLANGIKSVSDASSVTITIPGDGSLGLTDADDGVSLLVLQQGLAVVSIVGESGVTVNVRAELVARTAGTYSVISLIRTDVNTWVVCGDLGAA